MLLVLISPDSKRCCIKKISSTSVLWGVPMALRERCQLTLLGAVVVWGGGAAPSLFLMLEEQGLLIPYRVLKRRTKGDDIDLITFSGITTKDEAEALTGRSVWLDRDYLSEEEDIEDFFDFQHYVGFSLYDAATQSHIGQIVAIDESTLNTLLQVETTAGDELILPISEELIDHLELDEHRLYLQIPSGLFDL